MFYELAGEYEEVADLIEDGVLVHVRVEEWCGEHWQPNVRCSRLDVTQRLQCIPFMRIYS